MSLKWRDVHVLDLVARLVFPNKHVTPLTKETIHDSRPRHHAQNAEKEIHKFDCIFVSRHHRSTDTDTEPKKRTTERDFVIVREVKRERVGIRSRGKGLRDSGGDEKRSERSV